MQIRVQTAKKRVLVCIGSLWIFSSKMVIARPRHVMLLTLSACGNRLYINNHIKSKEELLHGICYPSFLHLIETAEGAVARADTPLERLRQLSRAHLTVTLAYQKEFSVSVLECRALSEEYRAEINSLWQRYSSCIYSVLDEAKAAGVVRSDVESVLGADG